MMWQSAKLIALDTETTGADPDEAIVVEIGAFFVDGDLDGGVRFGNLVNPGVPIPKEATEIHGITDDMVAESPPLTEFGARLCVRIAEADAIVGYNWPYDRRVLERGLGDSFLSAIANQPVLDALDVVRLKDVGRFWRGKGRHKLGNVAERMGIARQGKAHRCSSDAELSMRILFRFRQHLPEDLAAADRMLAAERALEVERFEKWKRDNPLPVES